MKYQITHRTMYRYDGRVSSSYSEAHLLPRTLPRQRCLVSDLIIEPHPADYREREDFFGNRTSFFSIHEDHDELDVTAMSIVEVFEPAAQLPLGTETSWESAVEDLRRATDEESIEARPFALDSPLVPGSPAIRRYAEQSFGRGRPLVECVDDLSHRIHRDFEFEPGVTTITTRLDEVLDRRAGVCQDFAHLAIGCLRSMGLAARYVSGYLETVPPPGEQKLTGVDASHAWASVYVPRVGWMDTDPTNDRVPNEHYITTAWGRDYADVAPLKGVVYSAGSDQDLVVSVDVVRLAS